MAAPQGNRFWEARSSHGRNPIFESPEQLWDAALQYFQWNEENPLHEIQYKQAHGEPVPVSIPKMRAMTEGALCIFLDISTDSWRNYKNKDGFLEVTTRIVEIIRAQKFQGAASEFFNANIIARDLGLADKSELTGKNGGPIETKELSDTEKARRIAFALAQAVNTQSNSNDNEE